MVTTNRFYGSYKDDPNEVTEVDSLIPGENRISNRPYCSFWKGRNSELAIGVGVALCVVFWVGSSLSSGYDSTSQMDAMPFPLLGSSRQRSRPRASPHHAHHAHAGHGPHHAPHKHARAHATRAHRKDAHAKAHSHPKGHGGPHHKHRKDMLDRCDELMMGVFEQECISMDGTATGTFVATLTDDGLVGIGTTGHRRRQLQSKFVLAGLDVNGIDQSVDAVLDAVDDLEDVASGDASGDEDAPEDASEDAPEDAPDDAPEDAPDDAPEDASADAGSDEDADQEGSEESDEDASGDSGSASDSGDEEDSDEDENTNCVRSATVSAGPDWIEETGVVEYNKAGDDRHKVFWAWGGVGFCSFRKLSGRQCRGSLNDVMKAFKHDETVDLGAYSSRHLC